MRKIIFFVVIMILNYSCTSDNKEMLSEGIWLAELEVMDHQKLPFNFMLIKDDQGDYDMKIYNASEVIEVDEIEIIKDSIIVKTPVFEGYIAGRFTKNKINGHFIKESLNRVVPFTAKFNEENRFSTSKKAEQDVSGIWEVEFEPNTDDAYAAKGIFKQMGGKVTGTFRTTTGDYRYLEGVMSGDSLKLSAFDGAHAFLFTAQVKDSTLKGTFYSGNHYKGAFVGKRNEAFELPNADSLTFLKEGYDKLEFSFLDTEENLISLTDDRFKNKVVIVQIMGTWCPNCLDETKYYINYLKKNTNIDLEIVALAFEYAKTKEGALKSIKRMKNRLKIPYPVLLAQFGSSDKELAQQKLPMLNHVLSYPTSIFIDKSGAVRKIHTGFNGPATGEKYIEFQREFDDFVKLLVAE